MDKKKYPTPATIVIRLNGDETTATLMGDEFRTRITRTIAKRNPRDEYDAYIGARVALDRLFDKDDMFADKMPEETEFQVGDIVRVTNSRLILGRYKNGDVAVVTEVNAHPDEFAPHTYCIKVRSKERKGFERVVFAEEITLLHRPAKEGEKR